jgi:hypothetical protein
MFYVLKTIFISLLAFSCISYNSTINTEKFKSFVEVYPIEGNPIEVYPIEAYLIGKGVVGVSGCSLCSGWSVILFTRNFSIPLSLQDWLTSLIILCFHPKTKFSQQKRFISIQSRYETTE